MVIWSALNGAMIISPSDTPNIAPFLPLAVIVELMSKQLNVSVATSKDPMQLA